MSFADSLARAFDRSRPTYLRVALPSRVVDVGTRSLWDWNREPELSFASLREFLDGARESSRIRGVVLSIRRLGGGRATIEGLRALLLSMRAEGLEIIVHLPCGADMNTYLASLGAAKVVVSPRTTLGPFGLLLSQRYFRQALDRAGIEPHVYAEGAYKSAADSLIRSDMSPENREQWSRILDRYEAAFVDALAQARSLHGGKARELWDRGVISAADARESGLVDAIGYEDDLPALLGSAAAPARVIDVRLSTMFARPALRSQLLPTPLIGVVPVHGPIVDSDGAVGRGSAGARSLVSVIRRARKSVRVRGVIVHVNSPGGSALASDQIWHEVRALSREKPTVAYLGDVAASGGYYVAVGAPTIIAHPLTITGSIGVIATRVTAEALLRRIGVHHEMLTRGARARLRSGFASWDSADEQAVRSEIEVTYRGFLDVVADGRKRAVTQIEPHAGGRVWLGADALTHGLVDRLGTFDSAVTWLRGELGAVGRLAETRVLRPPMRPVPPLMKPKGAGALGELLDSVGLGYEHALYLLARAGERTACLAELPAWQDGA